MTVSISAILLIPSCNGLETIGLMNGFSSAFTVIRVFVSVSPMLTNCIQRLNGIGEFSAANLMVLNGSRSTIRMQSLPTGFTSMVRLSVSNVISLIWEALSAGRAAFRRSKLVRSDSVAKIRSIFAGMTVILLSNVVMRRYRKVIVGRCWAARLPDLYAILVESLHRFPRCSWFPMRLRAWHCSC